MDAQPAESSKFKYVYCPTISTKEPAFPPGSKIAAQLMPNQGGFSNRNTKQHVLREFHYEHRYFAKIINPFEKITDCIATIYRKWFKIN